MSEHQINRILFYLGPVLSLLVFSFSTNLAYDQRVLASIMALVITWWLAPHIPLAVTGLIGVCLTSFFGVSDFANILEGFSHPVIFLFMGGFFIAEAIKANQLDTWIARRFLTLSFVGGKPIRLYLALVILTSLFSMFLSNTATTAMLLPIALSLFGHLGIHKDMPASRLIVMIPWASSIGGVATPIGSIPNAIAISLLSKNIGMNISFFEWMLKALPVMILSILFMIYLFKKELKSLDETDCLETTPPGPLTWNQKKLILIIGLTITAWMLPGIMQLLFTDLPLTKLISQRMPEGLVAILISGILFFIPATEKKYLLNWEEAQRIDWGSLLLFGSGIALGQTLFQTGLAKVVSDSLNFQSMSLSVALLVVVFVTLFITELVSNTAVANLFIPLLLTSEPFISHPIKAGMAVAMAASYAFMLPVGTPPNAMAYATGLVKLPWMVRKGIWLNLAAVLIIWIMSYFWY